VFFFDEAHLLFNEAPKALMDKIEQVVRLIRSKGVGVYFVTQNPLDVPDKVLAQLGNRVQHALRAFTPRDQKAVKTAAAQTFRPNPEVRLPHGPSWSSAPARRWCRSSREGCAVDGRADPGAAAGVAARADDTPRSAALMDAKAR
jgi:DNA helicase HerA-like ATPase